jgi:hypothetical protein
MSPDSLQPVPRSHAIYTTIQAEEAAARISGKAGSGIASAFCQQCMSKTSIETL